jgi:hypothetical protein
VLTKRGGRALLNAGLFLVLAFRMDAGRGTGIGRHWSEMHLSTRKSISVIWTSDGAADAIRL